MRYETWAVVAATLLIAANFTGCAKSPPSSGASEPQAGATDLGTAGFQPNDPSTAPGQQAATPFRPATAGVPPRMPIYVTPFYESEGLHIEVGSFSNDLTAATAQSMAQLAARMKRQWSTLPIETMYVAAIRCYDLGLKDEAVYWFHSATYRARVFKAIVNTDRAPPKGGAASKPPRMQKRGNVTVITGDVFGAPGFEATQAHQAFHSLAGEYVNGYAFGDLIKLTQTIKLVQSENIEPAEFSRIYPAMTFVTQTSWKQKSREVSADYDKLLDEIDKNADKIKATRKANGMEGKY